MKPRCLSGKRRWCPGRARATGRSLSTLSNRGRDHGYAMAVPARASGGVPASKHRRWQVIPCLSSCSSGFPRFCTVWAVHHGSFSGRAITKQYHSAALTQATRHLPTLYLAHEHPISSPRPGNFTCQQISKRHTGTPRGQKDRQATGQTNSTHTHMHMHMQ